MMLSVASAQFGGVQLFRALTASSTSLLRLLLARHSSHAAAHGLRLPATLLPLQHSHPAYAPAGMPPVWQRVDVTARRLPREAAPAQLLSAKERSMVRLYLAGCFHRWDELPAIARDYLATGCSAEELRGCVRHLAVFAGYPSCLAATLALQQAQLLPEDTPAKCGGPPGNAFELVYGGMTGAVRQKLRSADPALGEWIRSHCYGDIYSSPGLDLRQKQLLACAFLAQVHMPQQLLGHCIAALRFGASRGELEEAMRLGIHAAPGLEESGRQEALCMLDKAYAKYQKDFSEEHSPPSITVPDPASVRIPGNTLQLQ